MPKGHPRIDKELANYNGGRPPALTEKDIPRILEAIEEGQGFKSHTANILGISTTTLNKYIEKFPEVQEAFHDINQRNVDLVEETMLDRIVEGGQGSHILAIFYMKAKGGWTDQQTVNINHSFDWQSKLKEIEEHHSEIVDGRFVDDESEYEGWD